MNLDTQNKPHLDPIPNPIFTQSNKIYPQIPNGIPQSKPPHKNHTSAKLGANKPTP